MARGRGMGRPNERPRGELVGLGDNIMATGMARAKVKGTAKRAAFGDGKKIIWDHHSAQIFKYNPSIAPPKCENDRDLEWIHFYRGNRVYNHHDTENNRWVWNYGFKAIPGEIFLDTMEKRFAISHVPVDDYVVIEPNVQTGKLGTINKDWGLKNYQKLADDLRRKGVPIVQPIYDGARQLVGVPKVKTQNFRYALAVMERAKAYVGPEGGLHHAAAAFGKPGVVIFGGFIPPSVTGYAIHRNLTGLTDSFCGSLAPCDHCRTALDSITVDQVRGEIWTVISGASSVA